MFHWAIECVPTKDGFNFYKPSDPGSAGFIIQLMGRRLFRLRYSKITGYLYFNDFFFRFPHSRRLFRQTR